MDEKLKLKVIQLLQAASQGDQKATQTIQNIMDKAKQGDLEAVQLAQAIQTVMQEMLGQSQKAAHGAKLQYLKSLKHQCADDEELVYYKKGGSVKCGCEKKFLEGGTTPKKDTGVTKFRLDLKKKKENTWTSQDDEHLLNARRKNGKNLTPEEKTAILKWNNLSQEQKSKYQLEEGKKGMKVEKDCGGSAISKFKKAYKLGGKALFINKKI